MCSGVVQTLGHASENFLHFFILVVELVPCGDVRLEEQCDGLEQVVDVAESDVDVQSVLLLLVFGAEKVLFVRLGGGLVAWDLDQLGHFHLQWEISICCGYKK